MIGPLKALTRRLDRSDATRTALWAIAAYILVITAIRLFASPFLEIDEAQFVGNVDLRLVYGNSHPPLYNWLVRGLLEATGWRWALAVALLRAALLGLTLFFVLDAGRRLGGTVAGILALCCALLSPQVSWMSAHTLAHSLLVMAAAAGVLHGVALLLTGARGGLVAMAFWAGAGLLAKYNIGLLLAPLAVALLAEPGVRAELARRRGELPLAIPVFAVLAGTAVLGVLRAPGEATGRMSKLYREGPFAGFDVPLLGVDGALSLAIAVLTWGGISLALIAIAWRGSPPAAPVAARILRRTIVIGLFGFALFVIVADISAVHERYLTPLLMALPLLAGLHLANVPWRTVVVAAGLATMVAVPAGVVGMVAFDKHRFARPYEALAAPLTTLAPPGAVEVRSTSSDLAANMTIALERHGRQTHVYGDRLAGAAPQTLVQIEPEGWPVPDHTGQGWCVKDDLALSTAYNNLSDRMMGITAVIHVRCSANGQN
ncbi:MAG: glycosyltransferase family 39 protein [Pseudomonadota bacterium]